MHGAATRSLQGNRMVEVKSGEPVAVTLDDMAMTTNNQARLANRAIAINFTNGIRLAFGEQVSVEISPVFHSVVFLSFEDALSVRDLAIARGEAEPARLYVPAEIDVKGIRGRVGASQDDFASEFGFTVNQIKDWEQNRTRPIGGVRAYLMLIDEDPDAVRSLLAEVRKTLKSKPAKQNAERVARVG
jgi:putative transcriptional regulator